MKLLRIVLVTGLTTGCSLMPYSFRTLDAESFLERFEQDCKTVNLIILGHEGIEYSSSKRESYVFTRDDVSYEQMKDILQACGVDPSSVPVAIE